MFSLKEMFGKEVKVTLDPSFPVKDKDGWCWEIVGKRGKIYPMSLVNNTVCLQLNPRIGKTVQKLFGAKAVIHTNCDEALTLVIPVEIVRSTFRYLKPKRRRQLSPEALQALLARFNPPVKDSSKGFKSL